LSRNRKILLIVFIVVSVFGMWARYAYQRAEQRKREELFRRLSTHSRPELLAPPAPAAPTPAPEARSMFDSTLPQEAFDLVRQKVGGDFRVMELSFSDELTTLSLSADGEAVVQYQFKKDGARVEGPQPVQLIGGGKLADSLYDPKLADLTLVPRLAREAVERSGLQGAAAKRVYFKYPFIRYEGEGPEWTVTVEAGEVGKDWQHKFVTFDAKGKFKSVS
jgi:hypothetical protein